MFIPKCSFLNVLYSDMKKNVFSSNQEFKTIFLNPTDKRGLVFSYLSPLMNY